MASREEGQMEDFENFGRAGEARVTLGETGQMMGSSRNSKEQQKITESFV